MTKRSKKASGDDVANDGKTVDVGTTGTIPLLGLELTDVENTGYNLNQYEDSNRLPIGSPLLGTITTFQKIPIALDKMAEICHV